MLVTPASRYSANAAAMSAFDWSTHVRCPTVSGPPEAAILRVAATVLSLRDPFAPYVTETNAGSCGASASTAAQRTGSSSSDRGGKNSNENNGPVADANSSPTVAGTKDREEAESPDG
jgi:hypothetical protein